MSVVAFSGGGGGCWRVRGLGRNGRSERGCGGVLVVGGAGGGASVQRLGRCWVVMVSFAAVWALGSLMRLGSRSGAVCEER